MSTEAATAGGAAVGGGAAADGEVLGKGRSIVLDGDDDGAGRSGVETMAGELNRHSHLRVASLAQHHLEVLQPYLDLTAAQYVAESVQVPHPAGR